MPKAWCRDPANQFGVFEVREDTCHASYALAVHRKQMDEQRSDETRAAVQMSAWFKRGKEPAIDAGLGLDGSLDGD